MSHNATHKTEYWDIPYSAPECSPELLSAGYNPLLASVLSVKGIRTPEQAAEITVVSADSLNDPFLFSGMWEACERVSLAKQRHETIAVYGDYDVDGITSLCVMTDFLRSEGLNCIPYIPDRTSEGYGLNCGAIDKFKAQGVSLIITVDCGITAIKETEYARSLGIDVIITDHHECSGTVPQAVAVIDSKQPDDHYPYKDLCGVGVAFKFACAFSGDTEDILARYSDLVAIGTIADVMPLTRENKYIVVKGLERIIYSPRPGLSAIFKETSFNPAKLTASAISFNISPKLNAAGRLGNAITAARLLMSQNNTEASELAAELCALNKKRQEIEQKIMVEAKSRLEGKTLQVPIVLESDEWHQGVIGIAASRIAEEFNLPTIMIWLNGEQGKGSCRSYGNFNIYEALTACSDKLVSFGGHALAAGINIHKDMLDSFKEALANYYLSHLPEEMPAVKCDLLIKDPSLLTVENVMSLDSLEPYGNANEKPMMCLTDVPIDYLTHVGNGKHLKLSVSLKGRRFDGIFFSHTADQLGIRSGDRVDIAFSPQINEYMDRVSVQLYIYAVRKHSARELCQYIMNRKYGNVLCALSEYTPRRPDSVAVWRSIERFDFHIKDYDMLIEVCPPSMPLERFCICLASFVETGLLSAPEDSMYISSRVENARKADLNSSKIMKSLHKYMNKEGL